MMEIPKYWAKSARLPPGPGDAQFDFSCWQWSDVSLDDAQRKADARAAEVARKFHAGLALDRYSYGDRPLREEVVHTIADDAGNQVAIVSRNRYGALILNTAYAMFIDVDFSPANQPPPTGGFLRRLFGKVSPTEIEVHCLQQLEAWAAEQEDLSLNVYRTFAGLRCLVTSHTFDPTEPATIGMLRSAGSDPLYVRLCQNQACFRARLTPKPWRCGASMPPAQYPLAGEAEKSAFDAWREDYEQAIKGFAVCRLVRQIGSTRVHPQVQLIVDLHDRFACGVPDQPLA